MNRSTVALWLVRVFQTVVVESRTVNASIVHTVPQTGTSNSHLSLVDTCHVVGTVPLVHFTPTVDKSGTSQGIDGKGKRKVHPRTGHEGPEEE
jgi:hypothetical protein